MYKACMFDCDGTIADTLSSIAYFGNAALEHFGFKAAAVDEYRMFVGNGADLLVRRMLAYSVGEFSEETFTAVRKYYDKLYESDPLHLVVPYPGIPQLLQRLKKNGIKLAVISNKPDDMTKAVVGNLLGRENFDVIQGQLKGVPKKPDPSAPLSILKKLDIKSAECLYIGDSGVDMETGTNAGMKTVGVTWGFRSEAELCEHGAVHIVHSAAELEKIIFE
jgi:phosphoglycolate phosphatase